MAGKDRLRTPAVGRVLPRSWPAGPACRCRSASMAVACGLPEPPEPPGWRRAPSVPTRYAGGADLRGGFVSRAANRPAVLPATQRELRSKAQRPHTATYRSAWAEFRSVDAALSRRSSTPVHIGLVDAHAVTGDRGPAGHGHRRSCRTGSRRPRTGGAVRIRGLAGERRLAGQHGIYMAHYGRTVHPVNPTGSPAGSESMQVHVRYRMWTLWLVSGPCCVLQAGPGLRVKVPSG